MKKVNTRSILLGLLVLSSLASYIFLSSVEVDPAYTTATEAQEFEVKENQEQDVFLPDVELIKKAFELGKTVIQNVPEK